MKTDLRRKSKGYGVVIIDGPPAHPGKPGEQIKSPAAQAMAASILAADGVLIPVTPGYPDMWALSDMAELIERTGGQRKYAVLVNRRKPRAALDRGIRESAAEVGLPLLDTTLSDLVAYREAFGEGKGPCQWSAVQRHVKAREEVMKMQSEVRRWLGV